MRANWDHGYFCRKVNICNIREDEADRLLFLSKRSHRKANVKCQEYRNDVCQNGLCVEYHERRGTNHRSVRCNTNTSHILILKTQIEIEWWTCWRLFWTHHQTLKQGDYFGLSLIVRQTFFRQVMFFLTYISHKNLDFKNISIKQISR